ncbi:hypothetical protein CL634_11135 [bacterium]|nr:hypothetical protein [bacterium]
MILTIQNRSDFVDSFLSPIGKISERCVIRVDDNNFTSLGATGDGTLILYTKFKHKNDIEAPVKLNICDVNRLIKVLSYIEKDNIDLQLQDNCISYDDEDIQFKYFLLEDGVLSVPAVSVDKLKKLDYSCSFSLTNNALNNLNKLSLYANDSEKVYLYTKDGCVYGELNDKKRQNINCACIKVSDTFKGDSIEKPIPIKYDNLRTISASQGNSINTFVNTELSVMLFQASNELSNSAYFVSGMVS